MAIDRLNEAISTMQIAKQAATNRWSELQDIEKRYYKSNPELSRPVYYDYISE